MREDQFIEEAKIISDRLNDQIQWTRINPAVRSLLHSLMQALMEVLHWASVECPKVGMERPTVVDTAFLTLTLGSVAITSLVDNADEETEFMGHWYSVSRQIADDAPEKILSLLVDMLDMARAEEHSSVN
jgi:hypothetical protein